MSQPSTDLGGLEEFDGDEFGESLGAFEEVEPETMSAAPAAPPAPRYKKQGFGIYTVMLMLAFLCLLAGMVMMFLEAAKYN